MLKFLGYSSCDELLSKTIPEVIRSKAALHIHADDRQHGEAEVLQQMRKLADQNQIFRSWIGLGYSDTITPPVILRNILENPGWYTQYTPYQAEISQGRLEALLNFQTMVADLTGLPIANASLLDEGTAAAEAMAFSLSVTGREGSRNYFVDERLNPQTIAVVQGRAEPMGIRILVGDWRQFKPSQEAVFGALLAYPNTDGALADYSTFSKQIKESNGIVAVVTDLLAVTLVTPPGEWGADVAVGSAQRFGVPMGYGGPHAAFFATREEYKRQIPGRLVGVSKDVDGRNAVRLALQTREQHIRRDKATSNICTAQVLLAIMAAMYAVYHGPEGLRAIAERIREMTYKLRSGLRAMGWEVSEGAIFDTFQVSVSTQERAALNALLERNRINLRQDLADRVGISLDEATTAEELNRLFEIFAQVKKQPTHADAWQLAPGFSGDPWSASLIRESGYLENGVFHLYHSETEMLRYMHRLQGRDLSLAHSMIPLGSCTMKLNATVEMIPVTWPEMGRLHPFAPREQARGYTQIFSDLERWLSEITGFDGISLQPNSGAQGEYAGLMVIRAFHRQRGEGHRRVCLIPKSAHGTNPASAALAGMQVVVVDCDSQGNVDVADLRAKAEAHKKDLAALMVTYPSTHGVFEREIRTICEIVHAAGGQVYMDGANMNAQVALCRPGDFGPDVCHLNLHKTFCIPHGGGGPGMGPIGVKAHLMPFLPGNPLIQTGGEHAIAAISAAPWGSASILPISWMYIHLMGSSGLKEATEVAILNANYIARKLAPHYPVLYQGENGTVAHECIFDLRPLKEQSGVEVEDVAKRLMDFGFHAPTVSFPVAGTLMVEPTESESLAELDRFCSAMIAIREEIAEIAAGRMDRQNNPLKNAPHTAEQVTRTEWSRPYSREQAAFPLPWVRENKFWPYVGRINNVLGDRNVICTCPPMEAYLSEST